MAAILIAATIGAVTLYAMPSEALYRLPVTAAVAAMYNLFNNNKADPCFVKPASPVWRWVWQFNGMTEWMRPPIM